MATGVGMGFDLDALDKAIKSADKGIENLIKNGQRMEQALTQNFRNVAEQGVGALVSKMDSVNGLLANLGKQKSGKLQIETSTAKAVENAVRFSELMSKINNDGASSRTNSAVYKINEELEAAKRRLAELNKLLNFYAKGEGKSAIGFVDTSSTQQEARALMNRIDLLEREKASLQANARLRMEISQMRDNRQNTIDANYAEMAKRAAKESSEAAKAESRIYEERDAKREQAQREYDAMGRKMRQQTNLDLAREYELQEAQNKRNEGSLKQQMEAQRKFAEERVKLEETLAAKTKNDEHKRLQKEWQDQLKARDEAEKAYIKAEEQRQKEKNKQEANNAVATVNNLDKMHEQQHRKELQRIKEDAMRQQEKEKAEAELNKKRLAWVKQVDEEEKRKHQNELDRINKRFDAMRKREENQRRETQAKLNTTQGALASYNQLYSPQGVRSLNQMRTVLKQLETAQANINRATKEGQRDWKQVGDAIKRVKRDIESTEKEMGKFHSQQRGILDTSGQLARAMAAVFSVSAIKGYVNKLMQIRGEFELQQRSLQVLLQNKDEANALWDKTVALAVKSPYTTKQLVTATKQLAAYRVESEKLYETNKMLADVSIGLGVDMNRLILAFGQVKAANFLRGTELRQFSEAGVNMLDELAKRFTALEGRAVSVGEVFERVSKRMVSFADVEAVFKTITSEGGTFYQMQEKQSETLKGMMLNLKDSYELMLNDIGKSNEGMLKGFVSFMRIFVDGWREAAVVIKTAGTAMLFYFAASKIAKIGSAFSGLWATMAANPVGAIAAGAGVLIGLFVSLYQHTNKLNEALLEVEKNVGESLEESIGLYRKLTDTINDSTSSLDERNKAYEELKTKFKDILPDQQLELKYIQGLSFNYKKAEDAMFAYYNAKAIQQKKDKIESIYEGDFDRDTKDIIRQIKENIDDIDRLTDEQKIKMKSGVSRAVYSALEELKKGNISDVSLTNTGLAAIADNLVEQIEKNLKKYSGDFVTLLDSNVFKNAKELAKTAKDYTDAMFDVEGLSFETAAQKEAYNAMQEHNKEMETAISLYNHLVSLRQKLADNKVDLTSDESTLNEKQLQDREWYLNDLNNTLNEINKLSPDVANGIKEIDKSLVSAAQKGSYEFAKSLGVAENALYNIFADKAKTLKGGDEGASAMLTNFAENIKATADSKLATPLMEAITSAFNKAINDKDLSQKGKDLLAKLLPDEKQSTGDVRKLVEALLTQYRDEVKKWENATKAGATSLPLVEYLNQFGDKKFKSAMGMYLGSDEEFNELQQKVIPVLEHIDRLLGGDPDKDKKGRSRDLVDERLRVIKEIYKAYKELNKTFDETISKTGAMEKFGDAFYSAFGKTPEEMGYNLFTAEGVVDAYNKFISTLSKADDITKGNLAKGEFVMELQVEMQQKKDKDFQDEIERMFSGYEMSIELEKLNIPRELAESLFDVDTFDLSDIRAKLEQELYRLQVAGGYEDQIKKIQELLKKVSKMEQDEQEERLKRYAKFLTKGFNERINLKIKELRELELLEKDKEKLAPQQYEATKKGIQDEYNTKILKQEWEEFEKSSQYLNLFDDIENSSNAALRSMLSHLESLKQSMIAAGLPASDLKEILNQIEKVEEELEERTPFATFGKDLGTAVGKIGEYIKARKEEKKLLKDIENLRNKEKELSQQVAEEQDNAKNNPLYQTLLAAQKHLATLEEGTQEYDIQEKAVRALYEAVYPVTTEHQEITEQINETNQELDDAQSKTKKWKEALKGVGNGIVKFGGHLKEVGSFVSDMADKWQSAFGLSETAKADMETIAGVAQSAGDMAVGIGKAIANPADIGAYMQTVSGLMGVFATFGQAHDKEKERQIEREMKLVERLQKVYEDLGDTIKNAYSIDTLNEATQMSRENIMAQIEATNRMIEAEEGKKDTDWERIEDWKEDIEELKEAMKELEETRLQELGAFASDENKKSGAEAFLDAWMEAYKQTGDGLSGLNEQFDEFFEDMIKKQLLQRASNNYLSKFYETFDSNIKNWADNEISGEDAINNILKAKDEYMPQLNEWLKRFADSLGVAEDLTGSTAELSGLQAGIQGLTESQGDVLASYWSSVRLYTADTNTKVTELVTKLFSDDTTANPMLSQLLTIAEQTRAIRDLFDSVVGHGNGGTHSGAYLKVAVG